MLTCCLLEWRWTIGAVFLECSEAQFVGVAFDDCLSLHAGGPTGRGAVLCFCTVCTQIHLSRCDRSRYALLIGNENDSKLGHSDLSVT